MNLLKQSAHILALVPLLLVACFGQEDGANNKFIERKIALIGEVETVSPSGNFADPYGFVVKITFPDGSHRCGASLISEDTVLTAAHCVDDGEYGAVFIGPAGRTPETLQNQIAIKKVLIHPNYQLKQHPGGGRTSKWDLAVLKLEKPTQFKKIKINTRADIAHPQKPINALVLGWGSMSRSMYLPSQELRKARSAIAPMSECEEKFPGGFESDNMICTGSEKIDSLVCAGDSGGPIVVMNKKKQPVLIGVAMWGDNCNPDSFGGHTVFTNVSAPEIQEWLRSLGL